MGEEVTVDGDVVRCAGWRLRGGDPWPPAAFTAWHGLWEGFAALHGAGAVLDGRLAGPASSGRFAQSGHDPLRHGLGAAVTPVAT